MVERGGCLQITTAVLNIKTNGFINFIKSRRIQMNDLWYTIKYRIRTPFYSGRVLGIYLMYVSYMNVANI